jgi:hypothetical protein
MASGAQCGHPSRAASWRRCIERDPVCMTQIRSLMSQNGNKTLHCGRQIRIRKITKGQYQCDAAREGFVCAASRGDIGSYLLC